MTDIDQTVEPQALDQDNSDEIRRNPDASASGAGGHDPAESQSPTGSRDDDEAAEIEGELDELVKTAAQRDEYLALAQRTQADFENYRKRVLRQQEDQSARAALDLVGKLLPVLDTLDLAQAHLDATAGGGSPSPEALALTQSRTLLIEALAKEGLERVDVANAPFDPVVHDAVAHAPDDGPGASDGTAADGPVIDEVLRAGYRWRGQVLRPAMVRVRG
jgi:molecular chaperone GrpE